MSDQTAYDEGARWLLSDGSIIGKVHRKPDPQGVRLTLDMPFGDPVVAILAKLNASSMTEFCELARGTYNERKAEQAAQAERGSREAEARKSAAGDGSFGAEAVESGEAFMAGDPTSEEGVSQRLHYLIAKEKRLVDELAAVVSERNKWATIWRILYDASKDDEETNGSVQTTTPSPNKGEGAVSNLDRRTCEAQLQSTGTLGAGKTNKGLELLPDAKTESGEYRGLKKKAHVDSDLAETSESKTDPLK